MNTGNVSSSVYFEYFSYEVKEEGNFTIDIIREISPNSMD